MIELTAITSNGEIVKVGDSVAFTNSDGELCSGRICVDPFNDRRLYFWNRFFEIKDYKSLRKI